MLTDGSRALAVVYKFAQYQTYCVIWVETAFRNETKGWLHPQENRHAAKGLSKTSTA
jgi:hypothetical protein